jgi:hypothetical protein
MKVPKVSRRIEKNDEHMKAQRENKPTMSQNKKLEKEIITNRGVKIPSKFPHTWTVLI